MSRIIRDFAGVTSRSNKRAEFVSAHTAPCRKSGFTLAEVLITLGIIGVVAAMTMPTLIGKYQKKQTAIELKKVYSEMSQAIALSELSNSDVMYWDYNLNAKDFYDKYLKDYLKKTSELTYGDYKKSVTIKNLNGTVCTEAWCSDNISHYIKLANGTVIGFSSYKGGNYKAFVVDLNGPKPPNITGKDYFVFSIQEKLKVAPYGIANTNGVSIGKKYDRDIIKGSNYRACDKTKSGVWCTALIMTDNWEIKDDYPW